MPGFGAARLKTRTHTAPHESNWLLTAPLWILSFFAVFAGFFNIPHFEKFEEYFQPRFAFVDVSVAKFNVVVATRIGSRSRSRAARSCAVTTGRAGVRSASRSRTRSPARASTSS